MADRRAQRTRKRFVFLRLKGHDEFVAAAFESGAMAETIALLALSDERFVGAYTASPTEVRRTGGIKALRWAYYAVDNAWAEGELDSLIKAAKQQNSRQIYRLRAARSAFLRALNEYRSMLNELPPDRNDVSADLGVLASAMRQIERMGVYDMPRVAITIVRLPEETADYFDRLVEANGTSRWEALVTLLELHRALLEDAEMVGILRGKLDRLPAENGQPVIDPTSLRAARRDSRARAYPRGSRGPDAPSDG